MGRDTDAPLNQAPSSFDSKNPEKNNNKESSNSFSAMFTSLCNSAINFFKNLSKEESAKQEKTSSPPESIKRVEKNPQPQQSSNSYVRGLWKKLIPDGVFVEVRDPNTNLTERFELRPRDLLPTPINPSAISFNPPTFKEMQKSARNFGSSFKAKAGNAAVTLAGACGVASEGFNTQNARNNLGALVSGVSFFASSSPSGSPSAFSAQNLRSGLGFGGSESMAKTFGNFVSAVSSGSGSSASYGSGRYNSEVRVGAGFLGR